MRFKRTGTWRQEDLDLLGKIGPFNEWSGDLIHFKCEVVRSQGDQWELELTPGADDGRLKIIARDGDVQSISTIDPYKNHRVEAWEPLLERLGWERVRPPQYA